MTRRPITERQGVEQMEADNPEVMGPLRELIAQARKEGKWLWCNYQDLWFSPDQLEAANAKGSFRWGVINWKLRDPQEKLDEARRRTADAKAEEDRIAAQLADRRQPPAG